MRAAVITVLLSVSFLPGCVGNTAEQPVSAPSSQVAAAPFAALEGTWKGTWTPNGEKPQAVVITMRKDGSYTWVIDGKTRYPGKLTLRGDVINYANEAGSRGTVTRTGDRLVWRNVFTGNSYVVDVRK